MAEKEYIDRKSMDRPATDVVEVVRCKKCAHVSLIVDIIGNPHLFCGLSKRNDEVDFDDFCSRGERMVRECEKN